MKQPALTFKILNLACDRKRLHVFVLEKCAENMKTKNDAIPKAFVLVQELIEKILLQHTCMLATIQ